MGRAVTSLFAVRWRHFGERRVPKSKMNVQISLSGCHRLMLPPECDHRSIDTYLEQLHRRTVHLACRRRIVFGNLQKALVLSSSTSPLKRREKSTSKNAERAMPEAG